MKNNQVYLRDILAKIVKIEEYLTGISFADFEKKSMMQEAVAFDLAVIGEAANKITGEFRAENPQIPWRTMVNLRNVLIHDYFKIDFQSVWETCQQDLPKLKTQIEKILVENF